MPTGLILAIVSGLGMVGCFIVLQWAKKKHNLRDRTDRSQKAYKYANIGFNAILGLVAMLVCMMMSLMTLDDRKPIKYPIVERIDIREQYEYVEIWENPTTKCRYAIYHTRLTSGKMEINRLPNGKEDCPANRK